MFTARYGLIPYTIRLRFVFKQLIIDIKCNFEKIFAPPPMLLNSLPPPPKKKNSLSCSAHFVNSYTYTTFKDSTVCTKNAALLSHDSSWCMLVLLMVDNQWMVWGSPAMVCRSHKFLRKSSDCSNSRNGRTNGWAGGQTDLFHITNTCFPLRNKDKNAFRTSQKNHYFLITKAKHLIIWGNTWPFTVKHHTLTIRTPCRYNVEFLNAFASGMYSYHCDLQVKTCNIISFRVYTDQHV